MGRTEAWSGSAAAARRRTPHRAGGGDGHGGRARKAQAPGRRATSPAFDACVSPPRPCPAPTATAGPRRGLIGLRTGRTIRCRVASRRRKLRPGDTLISGVRRGQRPARSLCACADIHYTEYNERSRALGKECGGAPAAPRPRPLRAHRFGSGSLLPSEARRSCRPRCDRWRRLCRSPARPFRPGRP